MRDDISITESSGNIFADVGFAPEEAAEELLKTQLGAEIFSILHSRNLTQTAVAKILGVTQPEISRLKKGKFSYYSVERLMRFLARLNCEVRIHIVRPERAEAERVIVI
jgi:predicted XRE-type DNA-binding protein